MSIFITVSILSSILFISYRFVARFSLSRYFITTPYLATFFLIGGNTLYQNLFGATYSFSPFVERVSVVLFVLTLGIIMGTVFTSLHWKRMGKLWVYSSILLILFSLLSRILQQTEWAWFFHPVFFAYNDELVQRIIGLEDRSTVLHIGATQMVIIFYLTPIILMMMRHYLRGALEEIVLDKFDKSVSKKSAYTFLLFLLISIGIVFVKSVWIQDKIPFLFDFVLAMIIGFGYGIWVRSAQQEKVSLLTSRAQKIGTIGLYFYISMVIYRQFPLFLSHAEEAQLSLVIVKLVLIAIIALFLVLKLFPNFVFHEKLVAAIAGWTFMMNAPVVCMHGMRSVVNTYGPAPHVLLTVPPIILWTINYVQLLLGLIL
ncbi:hypothetical protein [Bacillus sp. 2205SS5-2]|uniref:hypothetical protein n=1 Tax=Bacillus sp. 2205SS5-2 TaxID=3109031 RepID=UPI003006A838